MTVRKSSRVGWQWCIQHDIHSGDLWGMAESTNSPLSETYHLISWVICFYEHFTIHFYDPLFFHGNIWTYNWPAFNGSGFIAQYSWLEHRTGIARPRVQTPLKPWIFFTNCEDQSLFDFKIKSTRHFLDNCKLSANQLGRIRSWIQL